MDRRNYWWVKLPIVTAGEREQCWFDHFERIGERDCSCNGTQKERFSAGDSPISCVLGYKEQELEKWPYLLLPLCSIPRQSFISRDSGEGDNSDPFGLTGVDDSGEDTKIAHMVPFRPTQQLYKEIQKCKIWMQHGVPFLALTQYYAGFVVPEEEKRKALLPVQDPNTHEEKQVLIALLLSQYNVQYSAPYEVFAETCKLNNLTQEQSQKLFKKCHGQKAWRSLLLQQELQPQFGILGKAIAEQVRETNQLCSDLQSIKLQ